MSQTTAERTADHIGEAVRRASCATDAIAEAVDNGVRAVKNAVKQSSDAADEFLDGTSRRFRRHPVLAVATTFAIGIAAGTLLGWMLKRR
jgi:ElaB/YqjD/DUF883 family membrane-anchored ribosome-binding protein